jgi:hypothetical protein
MPCSNWINQLKQDMKNSNQFKYYVGAKSSLYVNSQGKLIEPLFGKPVDGVSEFDAPIFLDEPMMDEWEDEDYSLLS